MRPMLFGMVLGIGGLGNGWRVAARLWGAPAFIGETLAIAAAVIWLGLAIAYVRLWLTDPEAALADVMHPAQGMLASLIPVSTLIASLALAPHLPNLAWLMFLAGLAGVLGFAVWGIGALWQGGRVVEDTTPVLYMPTVGGSLVAALAAGSFGQADTGWLFFGLGLLSFLAMEPVIIKRLLLTTLPPGQRATLGVHMAPAAVASVALMALTDQPGSTPLALMLFGYGCFQALVLLRLAPWLREQPFGQAAWAYTFGISALPLAALRLVERGAGAPVTALAPLLFLAANLIIGWIALRTLWALMARLGTFRGPAPGR
ncbi:dicarboxylate transporter/tellurite-resistance protein TehA [Phreatobacter stygius]|uniref:Dicarboxylate transporter/tellurite-resistance protein TehA n=1 Tax=Phreatobacter stygius TaxID=1940610 RepID=A0A4D7B6X7_9HYPH|nr:dicarboxylate transporter/tellurite-resistance protein TehA [Phreatobacter stygius]QCI66693.1 dicarboxylate transporter/tellurite-resistance protein TehA [Phreatobacter stygius]